MKALVDRFGRAHDYLRISLTDKCNLRCSYCMPENAVFMPEAELLSKDEILEIATVFVKEYGITKIRLTGGEPLVRKDFAEIAENLSHLKTELLLTTNGILIDKYIDAILLAGINTINVSLDSLNSESFYQITKRDKFQQVWNNILLLLKNNIRVKINVVAVKGVIENDIFDFINLTKELPLHIRFIEFMPFAGNKWDNSSVVTASQMLELVEREYDIVKLKDEPHATARKYKVVGHNGTLGFITTMSNQFCGDCNRIRLTAEGKMKNCLFGKDEIDLRAALRQGEPIAPLIRYCIENKHAALGGQFDNNYKEINADAIINRSMTSIGG
ncbi:MAG: GTP 3',8-cyclase MoaA [Sphingobacteriales bacterium]|nr:GTP 3',8-cyclase MoaA [Sphingobacteriales bacterium]